MERREFVKLMSAGGAVLAAIIVAGLSGCPSKAPENEAPVNDTVPIDPPGGPGGPPPE